MVQRALYVSEQKTAEKDNDKEISVSDSTTPKTGSFGSLQSRATNITSEVEVGGASKIAEVPVASVSVAGRIMGVKTAPSATILAVLPDNAAPGSPAPGTTTTTTDDTVPEPAHRAPTPPPPPPPAAQPAPAPPPAAQPAPPPQPVPLLEIATHEILLQLNHGRWTRDESLYHRGSPPVFFHDSAFDDPAVCKMFPAEFEKLEYAGVDYGDGCCYVGNAVFSEAAYSLGGMGGMGGLASFVKPAVLDAIAEFNSHF
ncbi:hypothetical protein BZA05DRAFT_232744 [Tricharina praecox]|uniref:uncharacterized protein n=1 Tax=Tricharina praecox TaxID=43433 RepID=UPI00221F77EF|nr:uncharacterized protein BZA05DRAFT_232744 [Tricharina praecox]KAI5855196.1 hypothetical protein BZA05DRAFT_232744 [Tricharina praecox]